MSQNLMLFYMQWVPKVQTMNQPNFWRELKWLGCKLTMVGPPFWIGKIGNNSVYGGGGGGGGGGDGGRALTRVRSQHDLRERFMIERAQ